MHFLLDNIEINLTSGVIIKEGEVTNVRAKTLQVLKFLILNKERIVTKQELLTSIWQDVVVQEQVLVQSIKEIRNILGSDVIKTYPRQGYQWTADIEQNHQGKLSKQKRYILTVIVLMIITILALLFTQKIGNKQEHSISPFKVAFLPIENNMPDDIHNWVPIKGMIYLNKTLENQTNISVIHEDKLLSLLNQHQLSAANLMPNSSSYSTRENFASLQKKLSADLVVQTKLLGYPQDFLLQYTFHLTHNIERGVLFSSDINDALSQLSELIIQRYGNAEKINNDPTFFKDFSNEAYTRGINFYHQREYVKAIPFFESALSDNPDFLEARRNLAASYVNSGNTELGLSLMLTNIEQAQIKLNVKEEMRSNLLLGVLLMNSHQLPTAPQENLIQAEKHILQAESLAKKTNNKLFIAYAYEELGKIKRLQGNFIQAIQLQKQALTIHEGFKGKYGQTTALIELSRVAVMQKNITLAEEYLQQAKSIAIANGVVTNQVFVLLAKADILHVQGKTTQAESTAQQAMNIATSVQNDFLKARVEAWLKKNPHYEIN